jgi:hypothetical protein
MVATDAGLVLFAKDLIPNPGVDPPIVRAAVLNAPGDLTAGEWSTLPDGATLSTEFGWTSGLLVNPDQSSADGGETNNWGRFYPGGGILDPDTGSWSNLPGLPAEAAGQPPTDLPITLYLSTSRTAIYGRWALDVPRRRWIAVPQNAVDGKGEPVELPRIGQATAVAETPSGEMVLLWGGARWPDWDGGESAFSGELTSDGFQWKVPGG